MIEILKLFLSFIKIGFTSFGGLSMVPLINAEMINNGWMTTEQVTDIVAIAEMTPGPLGMNCATFAGLRVAGVLGAVCANVGILLPCFTVTWLVAIGFERFKKSQIMQNMLYGIRPACIGMIINAIISIGSTSYLIEKQPYIQSIMIGCVSWYMLSKKKCGVPVVIVCSAVLGILLVR